MQAIQGSFTLELYGIPGLAYAKLILVSQKGNEAVGHGLIIGPFLLGTVPFPRFRLRNR